jgi:hypothetical protein
MQIGIYALQLLTELFPEVSEILQKYLRLLQNLGSLPTTKGREPIAQISFCVVLTRDVGLSGLSERSMVVGNKDPWMIDP